MALSKLSIVAWLTLPLASPKPKPQVSIPPLIPSIPGVTVPLASDVPPLPIAKVPTSALPGPPYTPSDIKPKKIGYFWTAAGDNEHADFLVSYSLDDDTFGTLLRIVDAPTSGNSPHHSGRSRPIVIQRIIDIDQLLLTTVS